MRLSRVLVVAAGTAALVLPALPAQAAHEANNKAQLSGDASGTAIVNYIEGRDSQQWTANARVQGLEPGTYSYVLIAPKNNGGGEVATVCTFEADGKGSDGCSNSSFDTGGFATAEIQDEDGDVVASGTFERRGGNRAG
jgi:hypothetical protein